MEKKVIKTKPAKKKVDLSKLPSRVDIIALDSKHLKKDKEYNVAKETAIILINKGAAKLK
tara:strand:- start:1013 stop:1192 length:180 start_codon:yes stop_codon:yes gene_type:complete